MSFATHLVSLCLFTLYIISVINGDEKICHYRSYETPCYDEKNYEVRRYGPTVWVKTEVPMSEPFWERNDYQAFRRLFNYISGENEEAKKIEMTSPVLMMHTHDKVEMFFMLPAAFVENPPSPIASDVEIYENPGGEFYVRKFSGWPSVQSKMDNHAKLKEDLAFHNEDYDTDMFFTAGYDQPSLFFFWMQNEVWIPRR